MSVSVSKLNFWVVSWNRDLAKMLKLSVRPEKIETAGRGEAACRQFQFFSGRIWQFQHFMPISRFHETCPKISTLTLKLTQKLSCLFVSFQVKLCDNKIKQWTRFAYETALLPDFLPIRLTFWHPHSHHFDTFLFLYDGRGGGRFLQ